MPEKKYKVGSDIYDIPEAKSGDFLKDFPDAVELETFTVGKDTFDIPIKEREAFLADFPDAKSVKKKFSSQVSGESAETSSQEQSPYKLETPEFDFNSMGSKFTPETPESVSLKELQYQPHAREFSTPELGVELPESKLGRETPGTLGEKYLRGEDIPRAEPPRLTTPVGDMLRSLKAGSMQTFGALAATPKMINDTLFDLVGRPIVKLMGATDEEAQYVNNYVINSLSGQAIGLTADAQAPLNKKAEETRKKMAVIEGNIWSNLNRGKDGERDLGAALELFGRGAMETVPFLIEVAATAGAGWIPTLGVIAATTATQQYAETEGMEKNRRLNAWMYGGFEGLGELATGVIFRGIGKAFRSGMAKNLSPAHAKSIAKGIASAVGLESSSEAVTQIGQNFTDIVTGRNLELSIFDNVPDAAILGGGLGFVGGGLRPLAAVVGRAMASDKDVKTVQDNFKQQSVLIDQLDKSGSESVKEALRNSIRQLNTQANELMDENYNLAQRLSEEERNQVTKLHAVATELQTQIDSGKLTPDESSALENTAKGIKDQIQTIKDNLVTRLEQEQEAEKQAKVDAIKEKEKAELDKIKEEESKKLEKAKNVKEGETVDKKKLENIKENTDTATEKIKSDTEGQLKQIEEEYSEKPITSTEIKAVKFYDALKKNNAPRIQLQDELGRERVVFDPIGRNDYMDTSDETGRKIRWGVELSDGRMVSLDGLLRITKPDVWAKWSAKLKGMKIASKNEFIIKNTLDRQGAEQLIDETIDALEREDVMSAVNRGRDGNGNRITEMTPNIYKIEKILSESGSPLAGLFNREIKLADGNSISPIGYWLWKKDQGERSFTKPRVEPVQETAESTEGNVISQSEQEPKVEQEQPIRDVADEVAQKINAKKSEGLKNIINTAFNKVLEDKSVLMPSQKGGYDRLPAVYIRFGEPVYDKDGNIVESTNYYTGKKEQGVSVYKAFYDKKTGKYILTSGDEGYMVTQDSFTDKKRKVYLVEGETVGYGADGENVLNKTTFKQIKEISPDDVVTEQDPLLTFGGNELSIKPSWDNSDVVSEGEVISSEYKKVKKAGLNNDLTREVDRLIGEPVQKAVEFTEREQEGGIEQEDTVKYLTESNPELKFLEKTLPSKKPNKKDLIDISDFSGEMRVKPIIPSIKNKSEDAALSHVVSKDELRPVMNGIFYDSEKQVKVASDAMVLTVIPTKISGKSRVINPKNNEEIKDVKYPDYMSVTPVNTLLIETDVHELLNSVNGVDRANQFIDRGYRGEGGIVAQLIYDGNKIWFNPSNLKRALFSLLESGTTDVILEMPDNPTRAMVIRDRNNPGKYSLVMPMEIREGVTQTILNTKTTNNPELIRDALNRIKTLESSSERYHKEKLAELKKEGVAEDDFSFKYHTEGLLNIKENREKRISELERKLKELGGTEDAESNGEKVKEGTGDEQPQITPPPVADVSPKQGAITTESTQTTTQEKGAISEPISETRPQEPDIDTKIKEVKNRLANNLENLMGAIGGIQEISGDQRANVIQILQDIIKDLAELTGLKGQQLYDRLKEELSKKGAKIADDVIDEAFGVGGQVVEEPSIDSFTKADATIVDRLESSIPDDFKKHIDEFRRTGKMVRYKMGDVDVVIYDDSVSRFPTAYTKRPSVIYINLDRLSDVPTIALMGKPSEYIDAYYALLHEVSHTKDLEDVVMPEQGWSEYINSPQEKRAMNAGDEWIRGNVITTGLVKNTPSVGPVSKPIPPVNEKYRKTQINSLIQDQTLQQQEVAKIVDANKETYTVMHQADAVAEAKALIDELGVQGASLELEKPTKSMADFPVRNVARMILLDFYSRAIVDRNASEQDKNTAFQHIDALQERMARENTKAGQGISMMKIWKAMQPAGVLEYVVRKLNKANETILKKKMGDSTLGEQLDELYTTLNEESRKIIEDILAGKEIKLSGKETKPPARRKTVPKERIKQEQDYRKNILAQYKAEQGSTLSASVTGLTKEQMELGGNLLASYVREGYYRVQDLIDKLTEDFKSVGVDLTDEQKDEILTSPKTGNESFKDYSNKKETKANDRAAEKFIDKKVKEVIREHWNKDAKDELRRTLAQKLIDEAGLSEAEAKRIEGEILAEFDKKILERSQKQLTKVLGTEKIPVEKQKKGIVGKMIDLINLGALDEQLYRNLFAEKFKLVELTDAHKEQILILANNVQMASGKGWLERDATIRLAKYIYELYPEVKSTVIQETMMDLAYANMLMGISTSVLNLTSAGSNIVLKPIRDVTNVSKWLRFVRRGVRGVDVYNPFGEMIYLPALYGIEMGASEAAEVYKNGDLNNKYIEEVAKKDQFRVRQVERDKYGKGKRFKPVRVKLGSKTVDINFFNLYKYSGRNLAAQDKMMLTTSYELEIAKILRDKFRSTDLSGRALTKKVMEVLRGDHIDMEQLNKTLEEDAALYREMTGEEMTKTQINIRRRELMMEELPLTKEEREEAEMLARSNIFTDDRGGMIATAASIIGRAANYNSTAGMLIKPFVPFTKVVGNVVEYMLDHTPYYGLLRANGMSVSYIKKKFIDKESPTAQMGPRGSRAYYEQMGRAWFGTMAFNVAMMMLLGTDEDDKVELSGGYNQEGFKKRGRENVLPPYTLRIGKVKIGYKNLPGLAIPLSLIGNINDALKLKQDEAEIQDRITASLLLEATKQSVFMVKDMSFVEGVQRLTQIITDFASTDEKKWASVGENIVKSYLGFATRPLPQNNNAVQQIWKFFDPTSYSQSDIKGIVGYALGIQHFVGRPSLDQFGEAITSYPGETLMPYTHWLKIKGTDERWKFLVKYNAIPNKLYNRTMQIEEADGIAKRKMEPDELFEYTQRTGKIFSDNLSAYMNDKEKVEKRSAEFVEREKANGETERISGVREDVEKLWADAKRDAEMELFRWGIVKEEMPSEWALIKKHGAYQLWQGSKSIDSYKLTPKELYTFNSYASLRYAEKVQSYLRGDKIDSDKKSGKFQKKIDDMWADAKEYATKKVAGELKNQVNK